MQSDALSETPSLEHPRNTGRNSSYQAVSHNLLTLTATLRGFEARRFYGLDALPIAQPTVKAMKAQSSVRPADINMYINNIPIAGKVRSNSLATENFFCLPFPYHYPSLSLSISFWLTPIKPKPLLSL